MSHASSPRAAACAADSPGCGLGARRRSWRGERCQVSCGGLAGWGPEPGISRPPAPGANPGSARFLRRWAWLASAISQQAPTPRPASSPPQGSLRPLVSPPRPPAQPRTPQARDQAGAAARAVARGGPHIAGGKGALPALAEALPARTADSCCPGLAATPRPVTTDSPVPWGVVGKRNPSGFRPHRRPQGPSSCGHLGPHGRRNRHAPWPEFLEDFSESTASPSPTWALRGLGQGARESALRRGTGQKPLSGAAEERGACARNFGTSPSIPADREREEGRRASAPDVPWLFELLSASRGLLAVSHAGR